MKSKYLLSLAIALILLVWILAMVVIELLMKIIIWEIDPSIRGFLIYTIGFIVTIVFTANYRKKLQLTIPNLKPEIRRISPTTIVSAFVLIIATNIVLEPLINIVPDTGMDQLGEYMKSGLWAMLTAVIAAPILEEYLFRGIIQGSITQRHGPIIGIVVTSIIFGAIHIVPQQAVSAAAIGLIIGSVYYLTGSLNTVIGLHALNNGFSMLMMMLFQNTDQIEQLARFDPTIYIITYIVSATLIGLAIIHVLKTVKRRKPSQITSVK